MSSGRVIFRNSSLIPVGVNFGSSNGAIYTGVVGDYWTDTLLLQHDVTVGSTVNLSFSISGSASRSFSIPVTASLMTIESVVPTVRSTVTEMQLYLPNSQNKPALTKYTTSQQNVLSENAVETNETNILLAIPDSAGPLPIDVNNPPTYWPSAPSNNQSTRRRVRAVRVYRYINNNNDDSTITTTGYILIVAAVFLLLLLAIGIVIATAYYFSRRNA